MGLTCSKVRPPGEEVWGSRAQHHRFCSSHWVSAFCSVEELHVLAALDVGGPCLEDTPKQKLVPIPLDHSPATRKHSRVLFAPGTVSDSVQDGSCVSAGTQVAVRSRAPGHPPCT